MNNLRLIVLIILLQGFYLEGLSQDKFSAIIVGKNPFMTTELYGGETIPLAKGSQVFLIELVDYKLKISYKSSIGFIHKDYIKNSDYLSFVKFKESIKHEKESIKHEMIAPEIDVNQLRFDSVKSVYKDSSFLVIRSKPKMDAYFFDKPHGNIIASVKNEDIFLVKGMYKTGFASVVLVANNTFGCIYLPHFETSPELDAIVPLMIERRIKSENEQKLKIEKEKANLKQIEDKKRKELIEQKKLELRQEQKREIEHKKNELTRLYGEAIALKIIEHQYWIGMTRHQARESIGLPNKINESVGSWGRHEQWVYDDLYLYFENDILKSYQRSR